MVVPPISIVDSGLLIETTPYPLSLLPDADGSTPDIVLEGVLPHGGRYAYAFELAAGQTYRFTTSGLEDGFGERAMLVDPVSRHVVWANALAAQGLGYDPATAVALEARWVQPEAAGGYLLYIWSDPQDPAGAEAGAVPFSFQAYAGPFEAPATDDQVYRFFDPVRGIELLTANLKLRDELLETRPDLRYDGEAFIGDDQAREGWVGVHEVLDHATGQRYYTTDAYERDVLLAGMPQAEDLGHAFYVPGEAGENTEPVFRMLNVDSGAWFLTANPEERQFLLALGNWADQGVAFNAWVPPAPQPPVTDDLVFRFFDPARGIERFTVSVELRDELLQTRPDLRYDGEVFVGDDQAREGWVGVHEVLDHATGQRYYTVDFEERSALLVEMAQAEDLGHVFFVPGEASENTEPVYRMLNLDTDAWFLTTDLTERVYLLLQGNWADQGVAFQAWVPPPEPAVDAGAFTVEAADAVMLIGGSGLDGDALGGASADLGLSLF